MLKTPAGWICALILLYLTYPGILFLVSICVCNLLWAHFFLLSMHKSYSIKKIQIQRCTVVELLMNSVRTEHPCIFSFFFFLIMPFTQNAGLAQWTEFGQPTEQRDNMCSSSVVYRQWKCCTCTFMRLIWETDTEVSAAIPPDYRVAPFLRLWDSSVLLFTFYTLNVRCKNRFYHKEINK